MRKIDTEIAILGGGATGLGVLRDLAMRGFRAILVEKGDLTNGTTGRYHGLLHSGARYVVKDPFTARECIVENRILRNIMPHCIEDTGGFFVLTPWDDPEYAPRFIQGCHSAQIEVEEISAGEMLRAEPLLNPKISRCFRVPDASADSFLAAELTAESARQHKTQILTYHEATQLITRNAVNDVVKVCGVRCHDLIKDEEVIIQADIVVNALGAWAGQIIKKIGIHLPIIPGKGILVAMNHRLVNTVVNRCKMPSDGDIIVPAHTVAIIGTTDVPVHDPDQLTIEPWEVQRMLTEGDKLVPGFSEMRVLRSWAGVRPLVKEAQTTETRNISRAYVLIDHTKPDNVSGLITITGGKWTTFRKMAEVTVDLVCAKLHVKRTCQTHLERLPAHQHIHHYLGARLAEIEEHKTYGELVCECELVTVADVKRSIIKNQANTIDDIRKDTRLGMGPCQGGFCTYRAVGMFHQLRRPPVEAINQELLDFLQERWKGLKPILWGQQLRQECLDAMIYMNLLNADHLPLPGNSRLKPLNYDLPTTSRMEEERPGENRKTPSLSTSSGAMHFSLPKSHWDLLVIGGGLAGLTCAWQAAKRGAKICLVTQGWGSLYWNTGCIDILGHYPTEDIQLVRDLREAVNRLIREKPQHPYSIAGLASLSDVIEEIKVLTEDAGYPLHGSLEQNWLLPTALGSIRATCLAPETMQAGNLSRAWEDTTLIVGFAQFKDFYPSWIVENLKQQGLDTKDITLELPTLQRKLIINSKILATFLEDETFQQEVIRAISPHLRGIHRIGFPAVLGIDRACEVKSRLERVLGIPVFEIPILPPSIPGMRLNRILVNHLRKAGVRIIERAQIDTAELADHHVIGVRAVSAGRKLNFSAEQYVLTTGGILGGGINTSFDGYAQEVVFHLPVSTPHDHAAWFAHDFLSPLGHPVFQAGITVNPDFQPIDSIGSPIANNLFAAGLLLSTAQPIQEHSLEGIAISTGYAVGKRVG